jgi:S-DNA-T family DNA segregation ATPase FtsK/SpoIIIE
VHLVSRAPKQRGRKRATRGERAPRVPGRLEAEAVSLALLALSGLVAAAVWSYHPGDPVWGFGQRVHNVCGPLGAMVAAALAGTVGWAGYALPIAGGVIAVRYLRGRPLRPRWIPLCAWSAFVLALAGSFEVWRRAAPGWLADHAGGTLGRLTVDGLSSALYLPGTAVVLAIALCTSFLVASGLSVRDASATLRALGLRVGRIVGQSAVVAAVRTRRRLSRIVEQRRERGARREPEPPRAGVRPRVRKRGASEPEVVEHRVEAPAPARQASLFPKGSGSAAFELPDLEMLARGADDGPTVDRDALIQNSRILEKKLADFNVTGRVVKVHPGPVITMYEFEPAPGVKVSRIVNLSDDLALALRAMSIRIVAPIPGKSVVGIEVPNGDRDVVLLRDLLSHPSYTEAGSKLTLALGKDIFGNPITADLARMPHLLVAGATGTGKSVFLNAMLCSLFFKATPDQLKLLLIDPKLLEFSTYEGIPHLISEVVTNPRRAAAALQGVVQKMEERYRLMAERGVRNIDQYNRSVAKDRRGEDAEAAEPLPYIVVVIDELADLMIVSSRDVEEALTRLAQMARAAGIHLVLATQRPSVDVLTGIIKANFPSRISFQVSSRTDSRTVLDSNGAEKLLGQGDMLFLPPGTSKLERIHGPYISENEVQALAEFLRGQGAPELDPTIIRLREESEQKEERGEEFDELYDSAVDVVARHRIASISFIQRKLRIGYNRAARLVEQMETEGVIGPQEGTRSRDIYVQPLDD